MMAPRSAVLLLLLCLGCDADGTALPIDAGSEVQLVDPASIGRGEYVVRSVAGCAECHTPRVESGAFDDSHWLAGVPKRFDLAPEEDGVGAISAGNLTPDATGIGKFSDADVIRAMRDGVGLDGRVLYPLMPYSAYHNMSDDDVRAVVAYLRTLQPVTSMIPAREPLPVPLLAPAPPVPEGAIPHTTLPQSDAHFANAEHGRYLAGEIGFCLDCHTPWRFGVDQPLDLRYPFAGGRAFSATEWVVAQPVPAVIYASNITPADAGIAGWTVDQIATALGQGVDNGGVPICRPMPSGPLGSFGGLSAQDALDVGWYVTTLPPLDDGAEISSCPGP
jgi:mono/diheme cytochrome c family protein